MMSLMETPENIRNVALVGNLHSGKTYFIDMLVQQTHHDRQNLYKHVSYEFKLIFYNKQRLLCRNDLLTLATTNKSED